MKFYTSVERFRNEILYRGYEDGKRIHKKEYYSPYLFVEALNNDKITYKNLAGKKFIKKEFDKMGDASQFIKKYENVDGFNIFGLTQYQYLYIYDNFPNEIEYDQGIISIGSLDIETKKGEGGYAKAETAEKPITLITITKNGKPVTFGYKEYKPTKKNVTFIKCKDERDMLYKFLDYWKSPECDLDIISGWNISGYDLPYIHNRLVRELGKGLADSLSPWGIVNDIEKTAANGFVTKEKEIVGISALDYMLLYKKFAHTPQESYSLEHICNYELDTGKLNYSEYASLDELEEKDYQKFVDYNILDTELIDMLEEKLQFISLAISIAYYSGTNFPDVTGTVRVWDMIIHKFLMNQGICIPPRKFSDRNDKFAGGYVKDVSNGLFKWILSFDVSSLYPSLISQYNISPETIQDFIPGCDIQDILNLKIDEDVRERLLQENLSITANGYTYDRNRLGFIPQVIDVTIKMKNEANDKMLKFQSELVEIEKEMKKRGLKIKEDKF